MDPLEFYILNEEFQSVYLVDSAESLLWTERYCGYGDFEIYASMDQDLFDHTEQDYYAYRKGSDRLMIIDTRNIKSDVSNGSHLKITGVSLEHLLTRRIIWVQTRLNGKVDTVIKNLLNANIINPSDTDRKIDNFRYLDATDARIATLSIDETWTGATLYDIVNEVCLDLEIGWKVTFNESDGYFEFQLYDTTDHSYDQSVNAYVVFSPSFDNIITSEYLESKREFKTVALVAGEDLGVGTSRKTKTVNMYPELKGIHRREMFVDARDLQSELDDGTVLTNAQYMALLEARGKKYLNEYADEALFEGEVESSQTFVYDVDYTLGDTVQIRNEYGTEAKSRIDEVIFSEDKTGRLIVPTFTMVDSS